MIKGVNKQVLEINEPKNGFFEKAIFFVKPEYSGLSEGKLRENAQKELEKTGKPPKSKFFSSKNRIKSFGMTAAVLTAGIIIGLIMGIAIN